MTTRRIFTDTVSETMGVETTLQNISCCILITPALVTCQLSGVAIPIASIVVGAQYLHSCPIQRYIPIYLVVMGAFGLALPLLTCKPGSNDPEANNQVIRCNAWNSIVSLFLFCWFIAGNMWIYSIYQPNYDPAAGAYCDKTLYLFAFWITTLVYIATGVGIVVALVNRCVRPCVAGGVDVDM
ncbi:transmembrane protein 272-like [Alosa pseudoharengus]|uniref:transmembrane protein 272-like n=1 Tax=Alosa pseudoharengus TaxID=34774 RepID=UPI003F88A9DA